MITMGDKSLLFLTRFADGLVGFKLFLAKTTNQITGIKKLLHPLGISFFMPVY